MKKFQTALFLSSISALIAVVLLAQNAIATDLPVSVTQFSYDARGQLLCQTQRMNPATFNALPDACVLGTEGSFGKDRVTQNFYDAAGQLIQVKQGVGTPDQRSYSTFSYSQNGKIIDTIDANGNRTHNVYDGFDRLSQVNYPSSVRAVSFNGTSQVTALNSANAYSNTDYETFAYDANNNKTSWRRRDGNIIGYIYDNLNRQITMDLPNETAGDVYTTYDAIGNIISKKFASLSGNGVSYSYDGIGRIISTTDMNNRTLAYQYNKANARTKLTYPDGAYIGYTLDALNRVSGEGYISNSGLFTQTYDNLGRLTAISKGAGGSTNFSYDGVGRLVSQTNDLPGAVNDVTYGFTAYNPANQIMGISINNNAYEFQQSAAISNSKSFDGLNHIVGFGYDARSNLTSDGVRNFAFDILNRMTSFSGGGNNGTMTYDPEGRLVSQVINGVTTSFLYDGTEMIAEYNSAGTVLRKYVHSTRDDDPQVWFEGAGNSDIRYVYANYQGSVVATTNAAGSTVQLYKYDPYGIPKDASNNDSWQGFRFRYTGQQILPEAKLYYYKARVYDPDLGIFLQTDPIGTKDDLNLYAYVGDDTVNKVDPDGMEACTGSRILNCDKGASYVTSDYYPSSKPKDRTGFLSPAAAARIAAAGEFGEAITAATASPLSVVVAGAIAVVCTSLCPSQTAHPAYDEAPQWVVRGGLNTPQNLIDGNQKLPLSYSQFGISPGSYGISVNTLPSPANPNQIALTMGAKNGTYSAATILSIRALGYSVITTPSVVNPTHATIVTHGPLSITEAQALSNVFYYKFPNPNK